ncbi:protein cholesin isoform 1-T2 [Lycodopsis pacificus]
MAKDKSLTNLAKRKKLSSDVTVDVEETMETKVKKKKKKMEVEEAPVQIPDVKITTSDRKQKKTQKKKQTETHELEGEEDLSPEEKRVLERKMKKILKKEEKKKLKTEGETIEKAEASGPIAPQQALDYLTCWAENRTEWKFQKTRQTWLLQHMFDFVQVPDEKFSVLLQYLEGLRGGSKDTTVQKALVLVEESGQAPEDSDVQQRAHRAREVIQLLS